MRTVQQKLDGLELSNAIAQNARGASILVANAVFGTIARGLWSSTDTLRDEARSLAISIMTLDEGLGTVCDSDLSERVIAGMAESAHSLLVGVRGAADRGHAMLRSPQGDVLLDAEIETALVHGYAIVIG